MTNQRNEVISRRAILAAGAVVGMAGTAHAQTPPRGPPVTSPPGGGRTLPADGTYATVPLAMEAWTLGLVQSRVIPVDAAAPEKQRRANVDHMCFLIDAAQNYGGKKQLLFFHEFPITGYYGWDRKQALRVAIDIPGPETERLAQKAREHGCWLVFGSYAKDPAWPDHLLSITTVMDDKGAIVGKAWKARNIKGVFKGFELFTTTVYDVLDKYVEMYGADAVVPVYRTPIGNLGVSSVQREPEYFRAMALKGAEVMLRTATGGFSRTDMQATSLYNSVYTAVCNNAVSPDNGYFFEDAGGSGGSAIFDPSGEEIATANSPMETLVTARIPIQAFRATHRQPIIHPELFLPELEAYRGAYAPNLFSAYLPKDGVDAKQYLKDKSRWR